MSRCLFHCENFIIFSSWEIFKTNSSWFGCQVILIWPKSKWQPYKGQCMISMSSAWSDVSMTLHVCWFVPNTDALRWQMISSELKSTLKIQLAYWCMESKSLSSTFTWTGNLDLFVYLHWFMLRTFWNKHLNFLNCPKDIIHGLIRGLLIGLSLTFQHSQYFMNDQTQVCAAKPPKSFVDISCILLWDNQKDLYFLC